MKKNSSHSTVLWIIEDPFWKIVPPFVLFANDLFHSYACANICNDVNSRSLKNFRLRNREDNENAQENSSLGGRNTRHCYQKLEKKLHSERETRTLSSYEGFKRLESYAIMFFSEKIRWIIFNNFFFIVLEAKHKVGVMCTYRV